MCVLLVNVLIKLQTLCFDDGIRSFICLFSSFNLLTNASQNQIIQFVAAQMLNNLVFSINLTLVVCYSSHKVVRGLIEWAREWAQKCMLWRWSRARNENSESRLTANIYDLCVYRMSEQKSCICKCMCDWRSTVKNTHSVTFVRWYQTENRRETCVDVKKGRRIAVHSC